MPTDTPFKERPGRLPTAREIIDGKSDEFTRLALGEDLTMPNEAETQPYDYVARFMAHLSDPKFSLQTIESGPTGGATNWGTKGKAAILERLSGVPEGFVVVPDASNMTDEQAEAIASMANCCGGIAYDIYRVAIAAAPQPPTVSDQHSDPFKPGWLAKDVKRAVQRCKELDLAQRQVTQPAQPPTVSTQGPSRAHFEILAEAMSEIKATSDGHSDQPIADIVAWCLSQIGALPAKSDLFTLTRERDQAREALAELLETSVLLAGRHEVGMGVWRDKLSPEMLSGMRADFDKLLSVGLRARSVLHPISTTDKEGSSS